MKILIRKNYAYFVLIIGFIINTFVWAFETTENMYTFADRIVIVYICIIAFISALFLGISFNQLISLRSLNPQIRKVKHTLRLFIIIETTIFLALSYILNSTTLFLMPIFFLIILSYPALKSAFVINNYLFGLSFAIVPVFIWAAVWGKFNSISDEFTFLPLILAIILMLWVSMIKIRNSDMYTISNQSNLYDKQNRKIANLLINANISVILGLLFFITIISGHTPFLWIGLLITVVILLFASDSLRKTEDITNLMHFNKLSNLAVLAYTINLIADVLIDIYFLPN